MIKQTFNTKTLIQVRFWFCKIRVRGEVEASPISFCNQLYNIIVHIVNPNLLFSEKITFF